MHKPFVALFFVVDGKTLLHRCRLENAEHYDDVRNYPRSHMDVWEKHYEKKYEKEFDFYPRGRVVHDMRTGEFTIYYDECCSKEAFKVRMMLRNRTCHLEQDKNYSCHLCRVGGKNALDDEETISDDKELDSNESELYKKILK